ncbi:MAG: phosphoglycerate mutase family protein [Anaerolineae bacterium]|nr:phosphoglycerate mutase family protein [Anaerolineae bacterium]
MPKLILIKHAKPLITPDTPAKSWLLSEEGQHDTEAFALTLKPYQPQQIFSSPEPKALETALTLTHALKIPFSIVDDLHEHQRANEPYDSDRAVFINKMKNLFNNPDKLVYGEETANQARTRFHAGLLGAWRKFRDNNIAVVAHGTVISLFVAQVIPTIDGFALWNCLKMPDAVVLDTVDFSHFTLVKGCE